MINLSSRLVAVAVGLFSVAACAKPTAPPSDHRAAATACNPARPAGKIDANRSGDCKKDRDCKAGKNGRCASHSNGRMAPTNQCSYDACGTDADCGKGLCVCEEADGNYCLPGNCRVDGDCGKGGFCSPTWPLCSLHGPYQPSGYYCHTPKDECHNDDDCPKPAKTGYGPMGTRCGYAPEVGRWTCVSQECPVG